METSAEYKALKRVFNELFPNKKEEVIESLIKYTYFIKFEEERKEQERKKGEQLKQ